MTTKRTPAGSPGTAATATKIMKREVFRLARSLHYYRSGDPGLAMDLFSRDRSLMDRSSPDRALSASAVRFLADCLSTDIAGLGDVCRFRKTGFDPAHLPRRSARVQDSPRSVLT